MMRDRRFRIYQSLEGRVPRGQWVIEETLKLCKGPPAPGAHSKLGVGFRGRGDVAGDAAVGT
jgi:hypothetical protein